MDKKISGRAYTPRCDFCGRPALYDVKTKLGPWAYVCQKHFDQMCYNKVDGLYTKLNKEDK